MTDDNPFARAWILYDQHRPDLAEREVRERIGEHPDAAEGYMLLARCLDAQKKPEEAEEAARRALELEPASPSCHFVLADTIYTAGKLDEAERAIDTALEMAGDHPAYHAVKSNIRAERHDWGGSLVAAERGLELDPEHIGCHNSRATALTKLGRHGESAATIADALAREPENAYTHANHGWMLLHTGDARQATVHFREALRLDPTLAFAREGLLEALRAGNRFYRNTLRFFLWVGGFRPPVVYAAFAALFVALKIGERMLDAWSGARWPALAVSLLFCGFCLSLKFGQHFANALLTFHPLGRLALPRSERALSAFVTLLAAAAIGSALAFMGTRYLFWLMLGFTALIGAVLASMDYPPQDRRSAWIRAAVVAASTAVGGTFTALAYELWTGQREALLQVMANVETDPKSEELERIKKLPPEERKKVGLDKIKAMLEGIKDVEDSFAARRKAINNRFVVYMVAGLVLFLFGNPLETKKVDD